MTLRLGCRLVVAPSFQLPIDWARRVQLGGGIERQGEVFVARIDWRQPDPGERDLLLADPLMPQDFAESVCLFALPRHLLAAWERLIESAGQTGTLPLDGFDTFVADVGSFLAFKELAVPNGAIFDLIVSAPGQRSVPWVGEPAGLGFNLAPKGRMSGLWGGVNLGDEATSLVLVNLSADELLAEVQRRRPEPFAPRTLAELAERFLSLCSDYSPVRLVIEPGEGFRLPASGLIVDGCTLDKKEPDVLLLVRPGLGQRC